MAAAFSRLTIGAGTFGTWKFGALDNWRLRHLAAGTIPASDISHLIFGVLDNWRLDFLRLGHFLTTTFGIWTFGGETIGGWEISCTRHLVVGTIGSQDISCPDFWRHGYLALSKRPIIQDISCPDFWCSGHFMPRLLTLRTFPAQTFDAQDISCPNFWRLGQLALSKRPIFQDISCPAFWHSSHLALPKISKKHYLQKS